MIVQSWCTRSLLLVESCINFETPKLFEFRIVGIFCEVVVLGQLLTYYWKLCYTVLNIVSFAVMFVQFTLDNVVMLKNKVNIECQLPMQWFLSRSILLSIVSAVYRDDFILLVFVSTHFVTLSDSHKSVFMLLCVCYCLVTCACTFCDIWWKVKTFIVGLDVVPFSSILPAF